MTVETKMAGEENPPTFSTKGRTKSLLAVALIAIIAVLASYFARCAFITGSRNKAFDAIQIGDTEANVIARFGTAPSVRERQGALFARYASQSCLSPCVERLWFENRLTFDTEAWSVELDRGARVVQKTHWLSP
jgi:hypothetical protein